MDIIAIEFPGNGSMRLTIQMPEHGRFTTLGLPHLARRLFRLFPQLNQHKCDNDYGYSFRRECDDTELPHLLEHLIIEIQSQVLPHDVLRGQTVWDWRTDPRGRFHVSVDYQNELLAIAAARLAERIIKAVDTHNPDEIVIEEEMGRLREIVRQDSEIAQRLPVTSINSWAVPAMVPAGVVREPVIEDGLTLAA